jgi:hypothetical protein
MNQVAITFLPREEKFFNNLMNNFPGETIKASMLFNISGRLALATICPALEVDNVWPKGRPFSR